MRLSDLSDSLFRLERLSNLSGGKPPFPTCEAFKVE
jgi:hypothetical protein